MSGPHQNQPLQQRGPPLADATAAAVLVHGRGATAESILRLHNRIGTPTLTALAPAAADNTWYSHSFLEPVETNEPGRQSGLNAIEAAVTTATDAGLPTDQITLIGFSQGACLVSEFLVANPDRYGGAGILSGGLLGTDLDRLSMTGNLSDTPVFIGCSDNDPYIPVSRVHETTARLQALGADVTEQIYPHRPHGVYDEELVALSDMVTRLV